MYTDDLAKFIESKNIPSADVIVYHNHKEIYRHTCGSKDSAGKIPLKGDELYFLYSATKPITCVAAMRLVERGIISIEDPVSKYIPEYASLTYRDGDEIKKCRNVMTVRHLFAMRGGLTYDLNGMIPYKELIAEAPDADTLTVVKSFAKSPLAFEPGTQYKYSLCHDVLGAVIEVASKMKLSEYLKKEIFEPLGMTRTTFDYTDGMLSQFAAQYRYNGAEYNEVPLKCMYRLTKIMKAAARDLFPV